MSNSLEQVQEKLHELLENARTGAIIPIRLPGQIEEILDISKQAQEEQETIITEASQAVAVPEDMAGYFEEEAYFVGHGVHELRTPMTSIRGYADMLRSMGELNDMQNQFMDVIQKNIKRMESLLSDMSYMNKIRHNTLKTTSKMDMFKNISIGLEKDMGELANDLNRQLELDVPQGLPFLNTDGDMLAIALKKIIENGLRYSAEGEGKVFIQGSADENNLVITIEDNGIGMTDEELARLGEIYFRSDHDLVNSYKGSGLGIPIAFGIIKILDGEISVESEEGVGTKFTIKIPGMS